MVRVDGSRLDDGGMGLGGALDELHLSVQILVPHVFIVLPRLAEEVLVLLGDVVRAELVVVGHLALHVQEAMGPVTKPWKHKERVP